MYYLKATQNVGKNKLKVDFTLWEYRAWGEFRNTDSWGWTVSIKSLWPQQKFKTQDNMNHFNNLINIKVYKTEISATFSHEGDSMNPLNNTEFLSPIKVQQSSLNMLACLVVFQNSKIWKPWL